MRTQTFVPESTYITPILCPYCGEKARLMRRALDPKQFDGEIRTFECIGCRKRTELSTD